jgi:flagellar hook-length control protein FliK
MIFGGFYHQQNNQASQIGNTNKVSNQSDESKKFNKNKAATNPINAEEISTKVNKNSPDDAKNIKENSKEAQNYLNNASERKKFDSILKNKDNNKTKKEDFNSKSETKVDTNSAYSKESKTKHQSIETHKEAIVENTKYTKIDETMKNSKSNTKVETEEGSEQDKTLVSQMTSNNKKTELKSKHAQQDASNQRKSKDDDQSNEKNEQNLTDKSTEKIESSADGKIDISGFSAVNENILNSATTKAVTFENVLSQTQKTDSPQILNQVLDKVSTQLNSEQTNIQMSLTPENLGKVEINISSVKGVLTAEIVAESKEVKTELEKGMESLKQKMEDAGLSVNNVEVKVKATEANQNSNTEFSKNEKEENSKNGELSKDFTDNNNKNSETTSETKFVNNRKVNLDYESTEGNVSEETTIIRDKNVGLVDYVV